MTDDDIDLRSVNWSQGMFLTPDHFLRQERYIDSVSQWLLRYGSAFTGLIGGGPRAEAAERGAPRFDPVVEIDDSSESLKITVSQCRGVTRAGLLIDVRPERALSSTFPKSVLAGSLDLGIYVVGQPHDKEPDPGVIDPVNTGLALGRRARYEIKVSIRADEAATALLVSRVRREKQGVGFARAINFIPPCAFMSSHSGLMQGFRQINETASAIADRYGMLHRAIVEFVAMARERDLDVSQDLETLLFAGRMVATLDECAFRLLDSIQPPSTYFAQLNHAIRSAAIFLSLSPPTQQYFREIGEIGEPEFVAMMQQENDTLATTRSTTLDEDLGVEIQKALRALNRLDRLEQGLEGRYMDYRVSPSLENMTFFFDRAGGSPVLYSSVARPSRPQVFNQQVTFVFARLSLEPRESCRIVLVGERSASFASGDRLTAEIKVNASEGEAQPIFANASWERTGHRNFAIDFKAPAGAASINDVRVSVRTNQAIRSAILYVRRRMRAEAPVRITGDPLPPRAEAVSATAGSEEPQPPAKGGRRRITAEE